MDLLLQKYNDYMRLVGYKVKYELIDGTVIEVVYREEKLIKVSHFYHLIQDRYENFSYDNLTTLNYTDAIVDFKASLIHSKISSDYILFEKKKEGGI